MDNKPGRLLFFDILRIASVAAIVFLHIALIRSWWPWAPLNLTFNIIYLNLGIIGVYILVFVSGAVLEYSHSKISSLDEISEFYVKRLLRIYPAFWMSLIIGLIIAPKLLTIPPLYILLEFIGFKTWSGVSQDLYINPVSWFISLIIFLYFLYPFLSASIKKYPYRMLFLIIVVEVFSRYFLNLYFTGLSLWFPTCNLLEFSLGVWIVQQNFYPKWTHTNRGISFLAEISFYVFLVHILILDVVVFAPVFYFIEVALLAWLVMLGDREIQLWLKKVTGLSG